MSLFSNLSELFGPQGQKKQPSASNKKPQTKASQTKASPVSPPPQPLKKKATPPADHSPKKQSQPTETDHSTAREAQAKAREIIVEAKNEALTIKTQAEQEQRKAARQLEEQQRELNRKLDKIEMRLTNLDERDQKLDSKRRELERIQSELEKSKEDILHKLEEIAGLTREEATEQLMAQLDKKMSKQLAQYVRQREEEAQESADEKVREILVDAMKHGATDYVAEFTISTVQIPSDDVKGKIIGKAGRNIHTFEKYTGVDVDLDASPTEVRLSCFDPVRREVARISLERLIKDGRIQPTRIEEVVNKVRKEMDKVTLDAGKQLCHAVNVYNLPTELMRMLGRFKFRTSYGQNLISHTLEETKIGIKLAHEVGADVNVVKLGCLLHDIGKVSEEADGSHVELGVAIAKKFDLPQPVIDCIAQHHEDEPFTGIEQMLVYIADAISGARPGARYENYEEYVKRLQALEEIALKYDSVKTAYAIQAGREVRVLLDPQKSKDDDVVVLATDISKEIQERLTYPGTVTVNVAREVRAAKVAK